MIAKIMELLSVADESLRAAVILHEQGFSGFAASRAYYTMFYVASAFLLTKELSFSKHSAVIAAFGKEFARTDTTYAKLHRYLIDGESVREVGDYGIEIKVSIEQSDQLLAWAREFLDFGHESFNSFNQGVS